MTSPQSDPRAGRAATEQELLARLGLTRDANTQDVESAYDDIVKFLQSAPGDLRAWAQREIAAADEAYALLSDPTADVAAGSVIVATAPAVPEAVAAPAPVTAPSVAAAATDDEEEEILADEPVPTRPVRKKSAAAAPVAAAAAPSAPGTVTIQRGLLTRLALVAAGLVGVAVLVVAVYNFGGSGSGVPGMNGTPAPESSAAAGGGVDQAQVGALMQKLQANPNDVTTLLQLANLYYQGQDFATAGTFFDKVLAADPKNVQALLGRGATAYNANDRTLAEKDWTAVVAIDPKNVDAHYYLGFMYLDSATPDMAKVRGEWQQVIDIDPTSDIAKTVKQHLDSLASLPPGALSGASTGTSAGSTTSPAPTAAPAASPSGSTAP